MTDEHKQSDLDEQKSKDDLMNYYDEETAAEITTPIQDTFGSRSYRNDARDDEEQQETAEANDFTANSAGRGIGSFAIVLSVLSLFFMPIFLGISGIVLGFITRFSGSRSFGNWAIGIGVFSLILTLFFSPFY
ncbi:MAG TPA: DUF4190 domain-containing protein [Bacilli bacterium]|nr:DUF4190 domain-containing protein [Bacilli bacterium]